MTEKEFITLYSDQKALKEALKIIEHTNGLINYKVGEVLKEEKALDPKKLREEIVKRIAKNLSIIKGKE